MTNKQSIIQLLLQFNETHYNRLYQFLSWDARVTPFKCLSHSVDVNIALEVIHYPKYIYNTLCDNHITPWNIKDKLLLDVITGKETINHDNYEFSI